MFAADVRFPQIVFNGVRRPVSKLPLEYVIPAPGLNRAYDVFFAQLCDKEQELQVTEDCIRLSASRPPNAAGCR